MKRTRSAAIAASVIAFAALSGCAATPAPAPTGTPEGPTLAHVDTIAVVGDSMSLGVSACGSIDVCPAASWAIGTDPAVDSIAERWGELSGHVPKTLAAAKPGAGIASRKAAVPALAGSGADLVLVLVGNNDACTASVSAVTSPDTFAAGYAELLSGIHAVLPDARIVAFSVPDLVRLWSLGKDDPEAVQRWNASPSCRSLLADADSQSAADTARRELIGTTVTAYNAAIEAACAETPGCTSDQGAFHDVHFKAQDVSDVDDFHPSREGQATLAATAWPVVKSVLVH